MLLRTRGIIAILALLIPILFFTFSDKYDRESLARLTHSFDQTSSCNLTSSRILSHSKPVDGQETLGSLCASDPFVLPSLSYKEWISGKRYTRVYMRPNFVPHDTKFNSLETIEPDVLPGFKSLDHGWKLSKTGNEKSSWKCPPVVDVKVAEEYGVEDTSKLLFGLATTIERLYRLTPPLLHSYGRSKASLLVLVPDDTQNIEAHQAHFRNRGLDITLKPSPLPFTARYFGLVQAFKEHIQNNRPHTTWVSWVDDDTFFLSLSNIAKRLSEYNASEPYFIGSLSELTTQVDIFGKIAYGGAGVFVSVPLLETIHHHYQKCQDWGEQPGDQKVAQCIREFGNTELTIWDTLYQMDLRGKPDGIFESGRQLESLHHWASWYEKDVTLMSSVSAAAGKGSVLRRWLFDDKVANGKRTFWVLTNGYSMIRYTVDAKEPADFVNFDHIEHTWDGDGAGYEARLGPFRPVDQPGVQKERWMLSDSTVVGNDVHQVYTRDAAETHSIIELVWLG